MRIITMGTYDLFHIGHLNILKYLKTYNDNIHDNIHDNTLIVGISTDKFSYNKKQRYPIQNQNQRYDIINSIKYVDEVFFEESMEYKKDYILKYDIDIFAIGDDWKGHFDYLEELIHPITGNKGLCKVMYIPRTPSISTSVIIEKIKSL